MAEGVAGGGGDQAIEQIGILDLVAPGRAPC